MTGDDNDASGLSRRRIIGGLGTIGTAGVLGGAATTSLLWDEEKFGTANDPNVLRGGELDLQVDWEVRYYDWIDSTPQLIGSSDTDDEGSEPDMVDQPGPIVNLTDVKPGDVLEATLSAHVFDNPAFLGWHYQEHVDSDNGINEPEDKVDGHQENGSDGDPFAAGLLAGAVPTLRDDDTSLLSKRGLLRSAGAATAGVAGVSALSGTAAAQPGFDVTPMSESGATGQDLAESLLPESGGISITSATYTGAMDASGTFTGGSEVYGIDQGVILSSGLATNIEEDAGGPDNNDDGISESQNTAGDSDLLSIADDTVNDTNDAAVLEFDFEVPEGEDTVFFNFVFGSDEYNEWIDSYNDIFGFFINPDEGTPEESNVALYNGEPVSINNINSAQDDNQEVFNNNDPQDTDTPFATEADGFTDVLQVEAPVSPGGTNTFKLAIADANDQILDSWVLIEGESLTTDPEPQPEPEQNGELDDVMNCVVWYDDGNNVPEEIWTGETELGDPGPDESLDEATREDYVMEVGMAQSPSEVVDTEAAIFTGTLAEMDGADVLFDAQESVAGSVAEDFPESMCYQNSDTEYVGVLCWVPEDIPGVNDNVIQTDRLEFQFGFDAIQCRHNVAEDGGPIDGNITAADAENNAQSP